MNTYIIDTSGAGHTTIHAVQANSKEEAIKKFNDKKGYMSYRAKVVQVTSEIQEIVDYDDPTYEG